MRIVNPKLLAIMRECARMLVAEREGCKAEYIEEVIWAFQRLPKNPTMAQVEREIGKMYAMAQTLAWNQINEAREMGAIEL